MITYVIQMDGPEPLVKFGRTKNPKSRMSTLATGIPWPLRVVCFFGCDCERDLKARFKDDHVRGEWYRPTAALQAYLAEAGSEGRLVRQVPVDQAYINAVIKPRIKEYLNGREPDNGIGGDLVRCIFADLLPTIQGREVDLVNATKGHISISLARGFGPATEAPHLIVPEHAADAPEQSAAA